MRAHLAAAGAVLGSLVMWRAPVWLVATIVFVAVLRRSGAWIVLALAVSCSWLGVRAVDGLVPPGIHSARRDHRPA